VKASPAKRVSSKRSSTAAASAPIPPAASAARAGAARSGVHVSGAASTGASSLRDKPRDSLTELLHRSAAVDQHCQLSEVRGQLAV